MILTRIKNAFADALFPKICQGCAGFIESGEPFAESDNTHDDLSEYWTTSLFREVTATCLCRQCRERFVPIIPPVCSCCGRQFATRSGDDHLCGDCIDKNRPFYGARAAGEYDGVLMSLIHAYKYRGKVQLARPLGALLYSIFRRYYADAGLDCAVPVPLHRKKLRQRGFDQVLLLLDYWRKPNPEFPEPDLPVEENLLIRTRYTESQTGLGKNERRKNTRGAFAVTDVSRIKDQSVLLVDDVYTTGATLEECARVLIRAGAAKVSVLTLARAM